MHGSPVRPMIASALVLAAAGLLVLGPAGCGGDKNPTRPGRNPMAFDIPTEYSLQDAASQAEPGDTLNVLFSPFPLGETVSIASKQTPLLIQGTKSWPALSISVTDQPILHFDSPKPGTRIVQMGFSGGYPAVDVAGSGAITVENCRFAGGEVQVYATGNGAQVTVTDCVMAKAGLFSIEMGPGAAVTATGNTIDLAGDCGLFLSDATAVVTRCIFWRSTNYGLACSGGGGLDPASGCNDIHNSGVGPYLGCSPASGDIYEDPLFCDPAHGDYTIDYNSPCVPLLSGCDEYIGALRVGCGTTP